MRSTGITFAAIAVIVIATLTCSSESVREVTVVREVKTVETVIVEKPIEIPVPQTVVVDREVTVEVPVEREVKIVETVIVEKPIEVPVPQTVVVERVVTVEVPVEREVKIVETVIVEKPVEVRVPQTVVVERVVTVENPVVREVKIVETVSVEKPLPVETATGENPSPTASAKPEVVSKPTGSSHDTESSVEVTLAVRRVGAVNGLPTIGPYAGTPTSGGGVEEYFFHFENGDPMTPELVESWDIDPAGSRVRITMRQGPDGNDIPFNSPLGFEDTDFGIVNSDEVVRYFNESNANINPDTTYGNSGDLAAIF